MMMVHTAIDNVLLMREPQKLWKNIPSISQCILSIGRGVDGIPISENTAACTCKKKSS